VNRVRPELPHLRLLLHLYKDQPVPRARVSAVRVNRRTHQIRWRSKPGTNIPGFFYLWSLIL